MSIRGDLAAWTRDRLASEVTALNRVLLIGSPTEFGELAVNPPTAGVVVSRTVNSEVPTPPNEVYLYMYVDIWFASQRFSTSSREDGLTDDVGIYQLKDDIHEAFVGQTPTSCDEPMEFQEGDIIEVGDGIVVGTISYRTARLI